MGAGGYLRSVRVDGKALEVAGNGGDAAFVAGGRALFAGVGLEVFVSEDGALFGRGEDLAAIVRPGRGIYGVCVVAERYQFLAGGDVPDEQLLVGAAGDDLGGVGVEAGGEHLRCVAFQGGHGLGVGK